MPPAKSWTRGQELFRGGAIEFFSMQSALFRDGVLEQEVKHWTRCMAQLAVALDHCAGPGLQISANRLFRIAKQGFLRSGFDFGQISCKRKRLPIEEVATPCCSVQCDLVRTEDEIGKAVARIASQRKIPPGVSGIARVNPNRVTMHT